MSEGSPSPTGSRRQTRFNGQITVEQARAFCHVADAGSYKAAADRIGVDHHRSLIGIVKRFGNAIGAPPLVTASSRGEVRLTIAGTEVLPLARRFVTSATALERRRASIRFSAYPSIARRIIAVCPELLSTETPLVLTDVSEQSRREGGHALVREVEEHVLDLAIAPSGLGTMLLVEEPLYDWTLRVLLPAGGPCDLAGRATVTPRQLLPYAVAAAPRGHHSRTLFDGLCAREQTHIDVALESASQELLRDLSEVSLNHTAVVPDDAFGTPDEHLGPALTGADGSHWGGAYSLYRRTDGAQDEERAEAIRLTADTIRDRLRDG